MPDTVICFTHTNSSAPKQAVFICPFAEEKTEVPCAYQAVECVVHVALGVCLRMVLCPQFACESE